METANFGLTETELDSLVTDMEAAVTLGCADLIGKITYRQALENYRKRFNTILGFFDEVAGK